MVNANHLTESPSLYMITVEIAATIIPDTKRIMEKILSSTNIVFDQGSKCNHFYIHTTVFFVLDL